MTVAIQAFTHATVTTSGQTTLSLAAPSGITVGDMLVIIQASEAGGPSNFTTPSGWTPITGAVDTARNNQLKAFYKIATSGDIGAAVTIGTGGYYNWSAAYFDITGAATTMPVAAVNDAASGKPTEPNITCHASGSLILWGCCQQLGNGVTGLAGTTLEFLNTTRCGFLVAYNSNQSGTVTGPQANTNSYAWACLALAMGPAGGGSASGSGAITLGGLTVSGSATASGSSGSSGSGAITLGGLTVSGSATCTSFTVLPGTIPAGHAGSMTLTLAGTSTTWTSGSSVSIQNSVTGTTTVTKGTWTRTSNIAATLAVTTAAGTGTFTITVDGVVSPSCTVGTASFTTFPSGAMIGTSPTITATGVNTVWSLDGAGGLFTLSGGTGASLSSISVSSNTSATFTLATGSVCAHLTITDTPTADTQTFYASHNLTLSTVYGKYIQLEGNPQYSASWGPNNTGGWYAQYGVAGMYNSAIRFVGSVSEIDLFMAPYVTTNGTNYVRLFIDNVSYLVLPLTGSGTVMSWFTLATGLDTTAQHTYTIVWSQTMWIQQVCALGGTGISTNYLPARRMIALYGDSILYAGNNYDASSAIPEPIRQITGLQIFSAPLGDTGVVYNNGSGTALSWASSWGTYGITPQALIIEFGLLDAQNAENLTTFQSAYVSMIQAIQTALPTTIIICEAISRALSDSDSVMIPYNAAIQAAVATVGSPLVYFRQGGFLNYQPTEGGGEHPNAVGYAQMGLAYGLDALAILGPPNAGGRRKMGVMS